MKKSIFNSDLTRCLVFNFLAGLICLIKITIALRFDFPYSDRPGNYSDWVLSKLDFWMTAICVWNLFYFIKMCRDARRANKREDESK